MNNPFRRLLDDLREDWRDDALCAQTAHGDDFFPEKGPGGVAQGNYAKAICGLCQVRTDCLAFALRTGEQHGIWGGLPPRARDELRRRRNLPAVNQRLDVDDWHGTEAGARRHHREGTKLCQRCSDGAKRARRDRERRGLAS